MDCGELAELVSAGPGIGFEREWTAAITLAGIELVHMMRKQQGLFASTKARSLKEQFKVLAA
ncbi:hypothetical protein ASD00_31140 [Ensifer sp. Root31]|nr:hypothetical protein ASD00_31140 [Ensifer sp. Root31]